MSKDIDEWFNYLDELSEINKLGGRGNGDLEDNCYVCGISPSKHKKFIQDLITKARIDELEKLKSSFKWGNGTDDIDERLAQLKGTNQ